MSAPASFPPAFDELAVIGRQAEALAEAREVDARLGGEQAQRERALGHLEREDRDLLAVIDRRVARDVERQGRLAHAGPRGEDDELARLQAAGHLVEVLEARRHAGQLAGALHQRLDVVERVVHLVVQAAEGDLALGAADLEDPATSATSSRCLRVVGSSKPDSTISVATAIRLRLIDLSRTIRAWWITLAAVAS